MSAPANGTCDTCETADGNHDNEQGIQVWVGWYEDLGGAFCGPCAIEEAQQLERDRENKYPAPMVVRTTDRNGDPVSIRVSVLPIEWDMHGDPIVLLQATRDRMDRDQGHYEPEGGDHVELAIANSDRTLNGRHRNVGVVRFRP